MEYRNDNMNAFIERGLRLMAITKQLEGIKKDSESDEVRAIAAAVLEFMLEIRPLIAFK